MEGLKLPKGALEKEKIRAVLSRLDMLEKRANDAETRLEELMKRLDSLNVVDKRIGALTLTGRDPLGLDGGTTRRHLIDDGQVQVAVQGQGQGTRDGRGSHYQQVGDGRRAFLAQGSALAHAEAVLLVDDGEAEVSKLDSRLDDGVRSHYKGGRA